MSAPLEKPPEPKRHGSGVVPAGTALPRRVGPYTLFEPIGRGGMAELFLARAENELGATRLAVVKLILPLFASDPKFAEMFVHEAKLAARLSHRHIVHVVDLGRDEEGLYIAMEYVEGFDLNMLLRQCSELRVGLPAEHALGIVADVLEGLDYAHRRTTDAGVPLGIVHRDVSPSNVLISYEGEVKLCDFGIAHANDLVSDPKNETLKGKAGYMSPEHARGEALDARADVFAAGIILWELLSGRRLYRPHGDVPLLEQARLVDIPPLPDRGLPNGEELERIVSRALAKDRDERYPSASAFQRDLVSYLAGAALLTSRRKLGEWIATTFGTSLIDQRRASERRLPKSTPPPRSSGPVRSRTAAALDVNVPPAPRVPQDLIVISSPRGPDDDEESAPFVTLESLGGKAMDTPPSSATHVDPEPAVKRAADDELISWARRRGWVTFLFFFSVAALIAFIWYVNR